MLWADATSIVRLKYAVSASSCSRARTAVFVVERLMLTTWKPCSIAHSSPASSTAPLPRVAGAEHAHARQSSHSGASERMIPAHAVPWPQRSPSVVVVRRHLVVVSRRPRPSAAPSPTSGWSSSTPLSRMQTRTPAPVAPPNAHSRVTGSGQSAASRDRLAGGRGQAPGRELLVRLVCNHRHECRSYGAPCGRSVFAPRLTSRE